MTGPDAVAGRVRRAVMHLRAARTLLDGSVPEPAAHSLYFAVFQLALALLASFGIAPDTHRGTQQMFSLHFVKPGLLPADFGYRLAQLATLRGLADYSVGDDVTPEGVEAARASVLVMAPAMLALLRARSPEASAAIAEAEAAVDALAAA